MKGFSTAACFALAATLLATSSVLAQAPAPRTTTTATQPAKSVTVDDRTLAGCVAIGNQTEVAVSQFAKDHLQNHEVKEFADMLIKEHQAFLQKLQKFTPEANRANWLEAKADAPKSGVQRAGGTQPQEGRAIQQTAGTSGQGTDFLQIRREIAQECLASAKKKLTEEKEHADKCFLGMQAGAHMAMISELTVLERHTSGELQQILADGKESAQKHLDRAESLMKDLNDDSKSTKSNKRD